MRRRKWCWCCQSHCPVLVERVYSTTSRVRVAVQRIVLCISNWQGASRSTPSSESWGYRDGKSDQRNWQVVWICVANCCAWMTESHDTKLGREKVPYQSRLGRVLCGRRLNRLQAESLPIRNPSWMMVQEYIVRYLPKFIEKKTGRGSLRSVITREYLIMEPRWIQKTCPGAVYAEIFDRMSIPRRGLQSLTTAMKSPGCQLHGIEEPPPTSELKKLNI